MTDQDHTQPSDGLLSALRGAGISPEQALRLLRERCTVDLGFAKVDAMRGLLSCFPEIVFAPGKTLSELEEITRALVDEGGCAVASRISDDQASHLSKVFSEGTHHRKARLFTVGEWTGPRPPRKDSAVAVVTAGTSDTPISEEAAVVLEFLGVEVMRFSDVGVAGIHRLGSVLDEISRARVCLVFAGMDAALPSVVGGLFPGPVIGIPTSTGYGTAFEGVSALLSVLNSCSPGVLTLNIDNGIGAAAAAVRIVCGRETAG